jgi:hypothetical protein
MGKNPDKSTPPSRDFLHVASPGTLPDPEAPVLGPDDPAYDRDFLFLSSAPPGDPEAEAAAANRKKQEEAFAEEDGEKKKEKKRSDADAEMAAAAAAAAAAEKNNLTRRFGWFSGPSLPRRWQDKGDHFKIEPVDAQKMSTNGAYQKLYAAKLDQAIIYAVQKKGWEQIYCFNGKNEISPFMSYLLQHRIDYLRGTEEGRAKLKAAGFKPHDFELIGRMRAVNKFPERYDNKALNISGLTAAEQVPGKAPGLTG